MKSNLRLLILKQSLLYALLAIRISTKTAQKWPSKINLSCLFSPFIWPSFVVVMYFGKSEQTEYVYSYFTQAQTYSVADAH